MLGCWKANRNQKRCGGGDDRRARGRVKKRMSGKVPEQINHYRHRSSEAWTEIKNKRTKEEL